MKHLDLARLVINAAQRGAEAAREVLRRGEAARPIGRGAAGDTTLAIDKAVEDTILSFLESEVDNFTFLGEETGLVCHGSEYPLFVVDPVDGSFNASRGLSLCSVSVAAALGCTLGDVVAGAVAPISPPGPVIWAIKGGGAYRGHDRSSRNVKGPGFGLCVPFSRRGAMPAALVAAEAARRGWKVRALGCASMEVCLVAEGRLDAYVNAWKAARPVDLAAALLIAREAGCIVETEWDVDLTSLDTRINVVVAADSEAYMRVESLLKTALKGTSSDQPGKLRS